MLLYAFCGFLCLCFRMRIRRFRDTLEIVMNHFRDSLVSVLRPSTLLYATKYLFCRLCMLQVQYWTSELERVKEHQEKTTHAKQSSMSSSSSNSTVGSITSRYDANQLKKEIVQAKSRVNMQLLSIRVSCSLPFVQYL